MSYTPNTDEVRTIYFYGRRGVGQSHEFRSETGAEFDRWLNAELARAWDEGFSAGERDVFEHNSRNDWEDENQQCIANPYRTGDPS